MNGELRVAIESDKAINDIWPRIGLAGYVGSISHGTAGDVIDDVDISGIFISPESHYLGLTPIDHIVRVDVAEKYDFALFELRKYFRLLIANNPNVLSLLWIPENMYFTKNDWGKLLLENKKMFLSKKLYKTFGGYAYSQLQRMTRCCTEQAYQGAKRKERFARFGYDCKNAAHLIRLLKMGIEALASGEINIFRHDAKMLKEIKFGGWTLEQVQSEADRLQKLLDESFVRCTLPENPDFKKTENLLMEILKQNI
ncbi:MAG: nucleotidyltransferase domain-containing protein [Lutibacter sp.]|jgi:predicted nucleotidyltransferase